MSKSLWALLSDEHRKMLEGSGVAPDVARERGYRTVERKEDLAGLGFSARQINGPRFPGVLIPMYEAGGRTSAQFRPNNPRLVKGKPLKYETPAGESNMLDIHPRWAKEVKSSARRLWIVEGVKKADALTSQGEVCVAIAGVYAWRGTNSEGGKTTLAAFEDIALKDRDVLVCFDSDALTKHQVRAAMERLVAYLRHRGARVRYLVTPAVAGLDKTGADDFLAKGGTVEALVGAAVDELPVKPQLAMEDIVQHMRGSLPGRFIYVPTWAKWLAWSGKLWENDDQNLKVEDAVLWELRKIVDAQTDPEVKAKAYGSLGRKWATHVVENLELYADDFQVRHEALDAHPDLLNTDNGVVHLPTGRIVPHDPRFFLTKITKGAYIPGFITPDVNAVTRTLVAKDAVDWLQRVFGYAAGGSVSEEIFMTFDGDGSNGKTTLLEAVGEGMGDYAGPIPAKMLTKQGVNEHPTLEADLFGMRVVWAAETEEGAVLAIEKVKALTGGDSRKARRMREDYWSFRPTHTMFLASNHRPTVPAGDYGTWRRMRLVKFPYRFVSNPVHANDRVGDPHMRRRLLEQKVNHDAIVTWLVEGAVEYARRGITDTPESVEKATEAWRLDEDPMSVFVTQKVVFSRGARIDSAELVATFNEFIRTAHQRENGWHGKTVVSQFESTASQRGETLTRASSHGRRYLVGVRWRTDADPGIPEASYGEEPETNGQPATGESTLSKILRIGHKPLTRGNDETGDSGD